MPRFTQFNTPGFLQDQLDVMNKEFEKLVGEIRNDEIRDHAARIVLEDHRTVWISQE